MACISKFRRCKFNLSLFRLCHPFHLSQLIFLEMSACSTGLFEVGDTKYSFHLNFCSIMSTIWCFGRFYWKFSLDLLIERLFFFPFLWLRRIRGGWFTGCFYDQATCGWWHRRIQRPCPSHISWIDSLFSLFPLVISTSDHIPIMHSS